MARIVWTEPALEDLESIAEYIALDKPNAAKKLVKKVFEKVERLKDFPRSGRIPPELRKTSYREVIVGPCRIFFRLDKDIVYILYEMHGEGELKKYLLEERVLKKRD